MRTIGPKRLGQTSGYRGGRKPPAAATGDRVRAFIRLSAPEVLPCPLRPRAPPLRSRTWDSGFGCPLPRCSSIVRRPTRDRPSSQSPRYLPLDTRGCAFGRSCCPTLGSPRLGSRGGEPGRGPGRAETRGGPARAPLARTPGSNPSDWLSHSRPRLPNPPPPRPAPRLTRLLLSHLGKAAAAASLPAGLSEQAAPRLLRVPAEPRHNETARSQLGNPKSLLRRWPTAVKVVETTLTLFIFFLVLFLIFSPPPLFGVIHTHIHSHPHRVPL